MINPQISTPTPKTHLPKTTLHYGTYLCPHCTHVHINYTTPIPTLCAHTHTALNIATFLHPHIYIYIYIHILTSTQVHTLKLTHITQVLSLACHIFQPRPDSCGRKKWWQCRMRGRRRWCELLCPSYNMSPQRMGHKPTHNVIFKNKKFVDLSEILFFYSLCSHQ